MCSQETQNISFKNLSPDEAVQSSTWRELFAIFFALKYFDTNINSKHTCWQTDNYAGSIIVSSGSNKQHLQKLAESIYDLTVSRSIKLDVQWVPRKQNTIADPLSKMYYFEDWETTNTLFKYLNRVQGSFTIDRFANNENCKTKVFNSKYWCPNMAYVDAFSTSWQHDNNYLVTHICIVPKAIKQFRLSKAQEVLRAPFWPSAAFWPLPFNHKNKTPSHFLKDFKIFPDPTQCFQLGNNKSSLIGSTRFKSKVICIKLDFS